MDTVKTPGTITILGINGHIGRAAALAFVAAGWQVRGFGRTNRYQLKGIEFVQGDAEDLAALKGAIGDSEVVFNALNLPYAEWGQGRAEAQMGQVIKAMGTVGKTLLFAGTIYNYAATDRVITPDMTQHPETPRGAIRMRQELMLARAAQSGALQAIIVRAGDFFGPDNKGDWFDQAMLMNIGKGKLHHLGALELRHAWAYLPDLAKALVRVAAARQTMGQFERFHFAGHYVQNSEMMAAIQTAAGRPLKVSPLPWTLLKLLGLGVPMLREIVKMRYLWNNPMALKDERLATLLGPDFGTPFPQAVAQSVAAFFPQTRQAA